VRHILDLYSALNETEHGVNAAAEIRRIAEELYAEAQQPEADEPIQPGSADSFSDVQRAASPESGAGAGPAGPRETREAPAEEPYRRVDNFLRDETATSTVGTAARELFRSLTAGTPADRLGLPWQVAYDWPPRTCKPLNLQSESPATGQRLATCRSPRPTRTPRIARLHLVARPPHCLIIVPSGLRISPHPPFSLFRSPVP